MNLRGSSETTIHLTQLIWDYQKGDYPGISDLIIQALYKTGIFSGFWWKKQAENAAMRRTRSL